MPARPSAIRARTRPKKAQHQQFTPLELARLRQQLLRWYDRHRRDLPWRRTQDPYRIWVSEVMLQQTRVQAVIPYYENFLHTFPDVRQLAKAKERTLLACWSGLGYYSRARNLQKAAQLIVREHGGVFPRDCDAAQSLPGIGRYTAAAVLSIAYGVPLAVLDGNVARVLARVYAISADTRTTAGRETLWQRAGELLSRRRPGDFNQAMMELGATVCLPQQPRCEECPIRRTCRAYLRGQVERYPARRTKPLPVRRLLVAAVVRDRQGRFLLVHRSPETQWMQGFWEFPMWEPEQNEPSVRGLVLKERLGTVRHSITEHRLEIAVHSAALRSGKSAGRWLHREELGRNPVTTITHKALQFVPA